MVANVHHGSSRAKLSARSNRGRSKGEGSKPDGRQSAPGEGDVWYDLEAMRTLSVGWHSGYEETVADPGRKCKPKRALEAGAALRDLDICDIM